MTLCQHLRAHQDIEPSCRKIQEYLAQAAAAARGIAIEAPDARLRKEGAQDLLELFGAHADEIDVLSLAIGASAGSVCLGAAVMTDQPAFGLVVGHRDAAFPAGEDVAAAPAQKRP